jgi:hypothetical protein
MSANISLTHSMAPGASIMPGSFHESSAATAHPSAASVYNRTVAVAPYLGRTATPITPSAAASGTGRYKTSGLPSIPGTTNTPIAHAVNAASDFMAPIGSPIRSPGGIPTVSTRPVAITGSPSSSGTSGGSNTSSAGGSSGSNTGNQNLGASPEGTLESSQLGNLLYDLLGPASTGATPGDAGLSVTPVSPTTTTTSGPNVIIGFLFVGALAGIGWYYWKEHKGKHPEAKAA